MIHIGEFERNIRRIVEYKDVYGTLKEVLIFEPSEQEQTDLIGIILEGMKENEDKIEIASIKTVANLVENYTNIAFPEDEEEKEKFIEKIFNGNRTDLTLQKVIMEITDMLMDVFLININMISMSAKAKECTEVAKNLRFDNLKEQLENMSDEIIEAEKEKIVREVANKEIEKNKVQDISELKKNNKSGKNKQQYNKQKKNK